MPTTTQPPKPKRRWYRFSLLTLLIVMLLSCFVFAWIGSRMRQARENRARLAVVENAVAAIRGFGGYVKSDYEERRPQTWLEEQFDDPGGADDPVGVLTVATVRFVDNITDGDLVHLKELTTLREVARIGVYSSGSFDGSSDAEKTKVTDAGLEHLKGLTTLQILSLSGGNFTDAGLEHLKGLTNLEFLCLYNTKVGDAGLEHLKGMTKLQYLNLGGTNVTEAGLVYLKGMTKLQHLYLWKTNITDEGLEHLKGLTQLEYLYLFDTNVTDEGLEHLKGLTNLKQLDLEETSVTDEGVKKLQQALPKCGIIR